MSSVRLPVAGVVLFLALTLSTTSRPVSADEPDLGHARFEGNKGETKIVVKVEGRPDGFDLHISARQQQPGSRGQPETPRGAPLVVESGQGPGTAGSSFGNSAAPIQARPPAPYGGAPAPAQPIAEPPANPIPQNKIWMDGTTIHNESPDGQQTTMTPVTVTVWGPAGEGSQQQLRQAPEMLGYYTYVNGEYQGVTWQPMPPGPALQPQTVAPLPADVRPGGGGGLDPYSVALDILAHIPLPDIKLRMNPTLGLVALPSWYWAEGYDGGAFGESRTIVIPPNPLDPNDRGRSFTVTVRVWGSRYDWAFGDGFGQTTRSLGKRYPAESDIKHTYEHSSLQFPGGFPVRMTAEFAAEFTVDGGGPQGLPPVRRTYQSAFRVQEVQPVLLRAG